MEVKRATTDALECHVSFDYGTDKAVGDEAVDNLVKQWLIR